ncbi:cobaltochelatase subunit CobN [Pseudomonas schmalbachii]|nr:cobaltochelatase subunit CobN [Pseudomonas schmalbachii]
MSWFVWLLLLACVPAHAAKSVLFLSAPPLQAGKYQRMVDLAREQGLVMEYRFVNQPGAALTVDELAKHDLLVIDAPYGAALGAAQRVLSPLLPQVRKPWLWIRSDGAEARGIAAAVTTHLYQYYHHGGPANFAGFFCQLNREVFDQRGSDCAEPVRYPESGVYHPDYSGRIFADVADYLRWKGVDADAPPPMVAVLFHKSYLDSGLTGFIDDTLRRVEQSGALPLAFYVPAMANGEITRMLSPHGKPLEGVLINTQIMLNGEGRKAEFERLGLPVLQAMPYRKGEQADWEADPVVLEAQDIPFYLAQPEYAGVVDPLITAYTREADGDIVGIDRQMRGLVGKALALIHLQRTANAEKKVAVFYYNYPPGEKNLGASFLNVPRSLETLLAAFQKQGYKVETRDEQALIEQLSALLAPYYRDGALPDLLARDLAERLPLERYKAWFAGLPEELQHSIEQRWGPPEKSGLLVREGGKAWLAVPRLRLGNVVLLPQPPRGERLDDREKALYHDTRVPPSHSYLATYLWARESAASDALVHLGTHGTYEWQPGKERGLSVHDYPYLVVGDMPVIYPYIVDNIGEALQVKRRGRGVTISHATPTFSPAGLHGEINQLHDLLHQWLNMSEGEVRNKSAEQIRSLADGLNVGKDMGWDAAAVARDFPAFVDALHVHLHELALYQQPLGLATFGRAADEDLRLFTVMQMLGKPLLAALHPQDPEEQLAGDYQRLKQTDVWQWLDRHVRQQQPVTADATLQELQQKGRAYWLALTGKRELEGFFTALNGRHVATSYGGDPIKNPDSLPTGRNLYGFDPSRIPTPQAWEAGREAAEKLIAQYREEHGAFPDKLAFSLWSVETMRHYGVLEAQVLAVMGFKPKWDAGGRVIGIETIPSAELQRPRVDAVVSVTGLYRDHFPNVMKWLAEAARQGSELDEADNAIAANSRAVEQALLARGMSASDAADAARTRIYSSESGAYGTGLSDATLASDTWGETAAGGQSRSEGESKLASLYLERMQFAYGPDSARWGTKSSVNAYAEHLKGVQGAVLSRSSNLYGMLTTDDPFQYLGGIGLAVRHLSGKSPELFISNLRDTDNPRSETAAGFLAKDLRARYFHPGWIRQMQQEGYSGALEILDTANNLWGWQVTAPETVRNDQWDEFKAVYVDDKYQLGMQEWFEKNHPQAQAQIIERMLEAARKEYWSADARTLEQLAQRWQELAEKHGASSENNKFLEFVEKAAAGYGLQSPAAQADAAPAEQPEAAPQSEADTQQVSGMRMEKQASDVDPTVDWSMLPVLALMLASLLFGLWRQAARSACYR